MDPRTPSEVEATGTLPLRGDGSVPLTEEGPQAASTARPEWVDEARAGLTVPGKYLAYEDSGRRVVAPVSREWTRIGRSLSADVRFDDATVSRRHALVVNQAEGVRVLDDRSLNGIFVNGRRVVSVSIGQWPSGVYFAQLTSGARIGYAPFVLRPRRLGEHPVAIVLPTQTWQAYNFRDDNGDGRSDTWYAGGSTARLARPFLNRGVPPHFKYYDAPFLRWALQTGHDADYLSDADLNNTRSGARLRKAYELLIFEGHHEYVTTHEYDVVSGFRNLGGNLMFLSANNFFWQIVKHGNVMVRTRKWRDLGRPEASLIGVQYFGNDAGEHRKRWIVRPGARSPKWLLDGTDLTVGAQFSSGGIEADEIVSDSPKNVTLIAQLPNLFGNGHNADMTYYESRAGAKVYAAGAFTVAGSVWEPHVRPLMENLWTHLSKD